MLKNAVSFGLDLNNWDVSKVDDFDDIFSCASSYSKTLCWEIDDIKYLDSMFCGTHGTYGNAYICRCNQAVGSLLIKMFGRRPRSKLYQCLQHSGVNGKLSPKLLHP